jgi:hypothetical protein
MIVLKKLKSVLMELQKYGEMILEKIVISISVVNADILVKWQVVKKEYASPTILLVLLILLLRQLHAHMIVKMMLKSVLMEFQKLEEISLIRIVLFMTVP